VTHIISFLKHAKVAKLVLSGELDIPALWHLAEGLLFFMNYFKKKEGFFL